MPSFVHDDIKINYLTEGSGEPLVFVSGSFTKLQMWNYQIDFFKDKLTVVAFDNRGVGKSSRPDFSYTMEMFVEDLKNLLDFLDIKEGIHLKKIIDIKQFMNGDPKHDIPILLKKLLENLII